MDKKLLIAMAAISLASCKRNARVTTAGYILGPSNEVVQIKNDSNPEVINALKSSVLIATQVSTSKIKFCSGTLIQGTGNPENDQPQVLTNFHCFAKTSDQGKTTKEFIDGVCAKITVFPSFSIDKAAKTNSIGCEEGSLVGDHTGDLARFSLNHTLPKESTALTLWEEEAVPSDRKALIVHYPDVKENYVKPAGRGARLPSASVTESECKTQGDFATQEWPLDHTLPYSLKHTCDIIHGSSGSALIDKETKTILGVNWGGIEIRYKDKATKFNAATKGYYVKAFLAGDLETIQAKKASDESKGGKEDKQKKIAAKCGVVGHSSSILWGLLLALPLLALVRIRR